VSVGGIRVWFKGSQVQRDGASSTSNFTGIARTDADGRFVFESLDEGAVDIWVMQDHDTVPWTYRAAKDIPLKSGRTTAALIELVRGIEITGKVILQQTGQPIPGVRIGVKGPICPWAEAMDTSGTTDAEGRYHYRLLPGETSFYPLDELPAYERVSEHESTRTVTIPDGVAQFEIPPIVLTRRTAQPEP
jgi:hypothetical protein